MSMRELFTRATCIGLLLAATATIASAQNQYVNPGFELGPAPSGGAGPGWITFGNVYTEAANPCIVPFSGNQLCKMFGNFWGSFNVSGIFQEFPTAPGEIWSLSSHSRYCSDDPMLGDHVLGGSGNWVVQKLAFFDATNTEIAPAAVEQVILDGSFAVNTWFTNGPMNGVAPAGCVKVQAFILYLQPLYDGGAAQIDDMSLTVERPTPARSTTWGHIKSLYR